MAQPPAYGPSTDFSDDESNQVLGRSSILTASLDAELAAIAASISGIRTNLALLQRDDEGLQDQIVEPWCLSTGALALISAGTFTLAGVWTTATAYTVGQIVDVQHVAYVCIEAHTSGTFTTDLTASKWSRLSALGSERGAWPSPVADPSYLPSPLFSSAYDETQTPVNNRIYRWPFFTGQRSGTITGLGVYMVNRPSGSAATFEIGVYEPDSGAKLGEATAISIATGGASPLTTVEAVSIPVGDVFEIVALCTQAGSGSAIQVVGNPDNEGGVLPGWGAASSETGNGSTLAGGFPYYAVASSLPATIGATTWLTGSLARSNIWRPAVVIDY